MISENYTQPLVLLCCCLSEFLRVENCFQFDQQHRVNQFFYLVSILRRNDSCVNISRCFSLLQFAVIFSCCLGYKHQYQARVSYKMVELSLALLNFCIYQTLV